MSEQVYVAARQASASGVTPAAGGARPGGLPGNGQRAYCVGGHDEDLADLDTAAAVLAAQRSASDGPAV